MQGERLPDGPGGLIRSGSRRRGAGETGGTLAFLQNSLFLTSALKIVCVSLKFSLIWEVFFPPHPARPHSLLCRVRSCPALVPGASPRPSRAGSAALGERSVADERRLCSEVFRESCLASLPFGHVICLVGHLAPPQDASPLGIDRLVLPRCAGAASIRSFIAPAFRSRIHNKILKTRGVAREGGVNIFKNAIF